MAETTTVEVRDDLSGLREALGMYIGELGQPALMKQLLELVDNAVDEYAAGRNEWIGVLIDTSSDTHEICVADAGAGLSQTDLKNAFTKLHASGKFKTGTAYAHTSGTGGTHGVGAKVVNATSEVLTVCSRHKGKWFGLTFEKGELVQSLNHLTCKALVEGNDLFAENDQVATFISYTPDYALVAPEGGRLDLDWVHNYLRQVALLNVDLAVSFLAYTPEQKYEEYFYNPVGLGAYLDELPDENRLTETLVVQNDFFSLVLAATSLNTPTFRWFTNSVENTDDKTKQAVVFRAALSEALFSVLKVKVSPQYLMNGLTGYCHVYVKNPLFSGQTKEKLCSNVSHIKADLKAALATFFANETQAAKALVKMAQFAEKNADALKDVKRFEKELSSSERTSAKSNKVDCQEKNPDKNEVFIVEGDSAGGHAPRARDSKTQAIIKIGGKIPNCLKSSEAKVLASKKIQSLILDLAPSLQDFRDGKLYYGKVNITVDPDVDGLHIEYLLHCFFARFCPKLYKDRRINVIHTPLFKGRAKDVVAYGYTQKEVEDALNDLKASQARIYTRFKGLGEINVEDLATLVFDKATRLSSTIEPVDATDWLALVALSSSDDEGVALRESLVSE